MTVTGTTLLEDLVKLGAHITEAQELGERRLKRIVELTIERDAYKRALRQINPLLAEQIGAEFQEER